MAPEAGEDKHRECLFFQQNQQVTNLLNYIDFSILTNTRSSVLYTHS